tara:strand:- start:89 stop:487 length:399 start_codon:yes stop_codon:yes gene_type:complete
MKTSEKIIVGTLGIGSAITTFFAILGLMALTSCDRVADKNHKGYSNEWRATVLKNGRHITVKNIDSLCVASEDTVTVFFMEGYSGKSSYYYITNSPIIAQDTASVQMYIDGKDTTYNSFESWNVVLDRRIVK